MRSSIRSRSRGTSTFVGMADGWHCCCWALTAPASNISNIAVTPTHHSVRMMSPLLPRRPEKRECVPHGACDRRITEQGKRQQTDVKIYEENLQWIENVRTRNRRECGKAKVMCTRMS